MKRAMVPPKLQNSADRKTSRKPRRSSRCETCGGGGRRWRRRSWRRLSTICRRHDARRTTRHVRAIRVAHHRRAGVIQPKAMVVAKRGCSARPLSPRHRGLLKIEGAQPRHHLVEAERTRHRRLGAGEAADALAKPAGGTDRRRGRLAGLPAAAAAPEGRAIDDLVAESRCRSRAAARCGAAARRRRPAALRACGRCTGSRRRPAFRPPRQGSGRAGRRRHGPAASDSRRRSGVRKALARRPAEAGCRHCRSPA